MKRFYYLIILLVGSLVIGCGGPKKFIETEADPAAMVLDARGQYLYVACEGAEQVIVWDVKKRKRLQQADVDTGPIRLYLDKNNKTLRVLCEKDKSVHVYTVPEMSLLGRIQLPDAPSALAVQSEKKLLFSSAESNLIRPYVQKNPMPVIAAGIDPRDMLLQPETDLLWVANYKAHTISIIDLEKHQVVQEARVWPNPVRILSTPMGDQIFVLCTGEDKQPPQSVIQQMDPFYKKAGLTWKAGQFAMDAVIDSMGRNIYVLEPEKIRIFSTQTGTQIIELKTVKQPGGMTVSPDGTRVYVSDQAMHTVVMHMIKKDELRKQ